MALVLIAIFGSNFLSTLIAQPLGNLVFNFELSILAPHTKDGLEPTWVVHLPSIFSNNTALLSGISLGVIIRNFKQDYKAISLYADKFTNQLLKIIAYAIPLFVTGYLIKLETDGVIQEVAKDYLRIFCIIAFTQLTYIFIACLIANKFKLNHFLKSIKRMVPLAISGFTTMSSAVTLPLSIADAEKNAKNKEMLTSVIPISSGMHMVGDCIAIPILAYAVIKSHGMVEPSIVSYLIFSIFFVIAKFSIASVPGGGIIIALPALEAYLGFTNSMMSLITALYILLDPIITAANVMGNSVFNALIDKLITHQKN
jgi:Na+/H+-dicarboxylate symporter